MSVRYNIDGIFYNYYFILKIRLIQNVIFLWIGAGHFADRLISNRWTVLSVRRLMTGIGLIGPGVFLLAFCTVDNLLAAVL